MQTFTFDGQPDVVALETLRFEELGDGRTRPQSTGASPARSRVTAITLPPGPSVDDDPAGAWRSQCDAVQALLDDPTVAERRYELPHLGTMALGQAVDMIYTGDVFLHRWDLARAIGQDETLDPQKCAEMLEGMLPMDEARRGSGHYGPRDEVPEGADVQTRLLAFIGRAPRRSRCSFGP